MALVFTGAVILGPGFLPLHGSYPLAVLLAGKTNSLEHEDDEGLDVEERRLLVKLDYQTLCALG